MRKTTLFLASALLAASTQSAHADTYLSQRYAKDEIPARQTAAYEDRIESAAEGIATPAQDLLLTKTLLEVGGQFSGYKYSEPNFMKITGAKYGLTIGATLALKDRWFAAVEGRYATGDDEYKGSGTLNNVPDDIYEIRGLIGWDYLTSAAPKLSLSPYVGLGYRHLANDLRGVTSTGAVGYRRDSEYVYMPIGVHPRYALNNGARLNFTLEYDILLDGKQRTRLSDFSPAYSDITNDQYNRGYGFRADAMYEARRWSFGPFMSYWNLDTSDPAYVSSTLIGYEPNNWTVEYGVQAKYRFSSY